jgi:hypothetical protein
MWRRWWTYWDYRYKVCRRKRKRRRRRRRKGEKEVINQNVKEVVDFLGF